MSKLLSSMGVKLKTAEVTNPVSQKDKVSLTPVGDSKIAEKFSKWQEDNSSKFEEGQKVEDFSFSSPEYASAVNANDTAKIAQTYKQNLLNFAISSIKTYDKDNDKKINLGEFSQKEFDDYKKAFPDDTTITIEDVKEMTKKSFNNIDLDNNGNIDEKEQAAVLALYDKNQDGKISMQEYSDVSKMVPMTGFKTLVDKIYKSIFG